MTKVKICGLSTPETVTTALDTGANFIGLVFYPPSPRHVEIEVAAYLAKQIPDTVEIVGLFVNPDDALLGQMLNELPLTMIQLHGDETPERVMEVKQKLKLPVIKALSIETTDDLQKAEQYQKSADWLLFDAKGEKLPGGNGKPFDWNILADYQSDTPWMLAGGLTPDNVSEALQITSPNAVDVSSGVESAPGIKDVRKIQTFISAVKQA